MSNANMNDAATQSVHMLDVRNLTAEAFASYGQLARRCAPAGRVSTPVTTRRRRPKLVLSNGESRLWIVHLRHVGLCFSRITRQRRVMQCLGLLGGKEWLIGVALPGDFGDDARPRLEDTVTVRTPGDWVIRQHVETWHAGPHFVHDECLETLDINRRDFHGVPLPAECGCGSEPTRGEPPAQSSGPIFSERAIACRYRSTMMRSITCWPVPGSLSPKARRMS